MFVRAVLFNAEISRFRALDIGTLEHLLSNLPAKALSSVEFFPLLTQRVPFAPKLLQGTSETPQCTLEGWKANPLNLHVQGIKAFILFRFDLRRPSCVHFFGRDQTQLQDTHTQHS